MYNISMDIYQPGNLLSLTYEHGSIDTIVSIICAKSYDIGNGKTRSYFEILYGDHILYMEPLFGMERPRVHISPIDYPDFNHSYLYRATLLERL